MALKKELSMTSCEDIQEYCLNIVKEEKEGFYWVHGEDVHRQLKRRTYCDFVNNRQGEFSRFLPIYYYAQLTTESRINVTSDIW